MFSNQEHLNSLYSKILFTLFIILISRIGSYIPIPGIDAIELARFYEQNQGGLLGTLNLLSGGAISRMAIFSLGIFPYITSSIIVQLLCLIYPSLDALKKEGSVGKKKINQLTRVLTILLASFQAFGVAITLLSIVTQSGRVVILEPYLFKITTVITLVVGTIFLMWLGEQITVSGIGNGISLIIFAGIAAALPGNLGSLFSLARAGALSIFVALFAVALMFGTIVLVVFVERALRKIPIQNPNKSYMQQGVSSQSNFVPIKINNAGVIPPIFASSLLLFPSTIAGFSGNQNETLNYIASHLSHGQPMYILLFSLCVLFFSFFYTSIVFNAEDVAQNLQKGSSYIPGIRPGANTAEYLDSILSKLTLIGAVYLIFICITPEIFMSKYGVALSLSGTSLLIVVSVIMDTITQVQTYLYTTQYGGLVKRVKVRHRG